MLRSRQQTPPAEKLMRWSAWPLGRRRGLATITIVPDLSLNVGAAGGLEVLEADTDSHLAGPRRRSGRAAEMGVTPASLKI
jgi:hypothetical protein